MQSSLPRPRLLSASSRRVGVPLDLVVLLAWIAVFGAGLRVLVGWPAVPMLPDHLPSWTAVQVWTQSPGASLDGLISWAGVLAWAVWLWTLASVALRVAVDVADALTRGARWVGTARLVSDWLTLPLVRRTVDASLASLLLARVATASVVAEASPLAYAPVMAVQTHASGRDGHAAMWAASRPVDPDDASEEHASAAGDVVYTVRAGDTLSAIALEFYGDAEQSERIYQANLGREQPGGRVFNRHGLILPGWTLLIPSPTHGIVEEQDGTRWYVVKHGDSLRGIAADLLGDEERYGELFDLNVGEARLGADGPVLQHPDLIWPGLRLRLPDAPQSSEPAAEPPAQESESSAPQPEPVAASAPTVPEEPTPAPSPAATAPSDVPAASMPVDATTPEPTEVPEPPMVVPTPASAAAGSDAPQRGARLVPDPAVVGGAGAAGVILVGGVAGALVVRRRRPAPLPTSPETDVRVERGFAEADPVEGLARRLAHTSDPPGAIASLLGQAYMAVLAEQLSEDQRHEATEGVRVVATRHGRTSTTLVLAAPVPARPHLIHGMRAAAERAFGEHVDVDGQVSSDGDVLVRVTWDPRHPVSPRVLELVGPDAGPSLWPAPCLVSLLVLFDRQEFDANWRMLSNVLIAAPTGQGAEVPLSALVASLASVRRPENLGLVLLARPGTLPEELGRLPHGLLDPIDPADPMAVQRALEGVRLELDRRMASGGADEPDLVVVVRELGDLEPAAIDLLGAIATAGPRHGVRLLVASERPVAEVLRACPFVGELGTRLVLQAKDEEESVALLGGPGAEELRPGGHALLRLESRAAIHGWARQVPADHLARLLSLMGTRAPQTVEPTAGPGDPAVDDGPSVDEEEVTDDADEPEVGPADPEPAPAPDAPPQPAGHETTWPGSALLRRLRAAPIRVRCFGAREVWYGDRQLAIADPELLLLLAVHPPVTGIQSEALADMIWGEDEPKDAARGLRKRRFRLREELRQLAPEVTAEPLPKDMKHGERLVVLNPDVVSSDVQEFLELLKCARTLEPAAAIQAYEEALALYRGDLLESIDVPNFRWLYDGPQIALTLRSDYERMQREARLHLADLLAAGPEQGLGRAAELYVGLCAERPEDERLWTALFRVHEQAGSVLGLESAVRRLRAALAEMAPGEVDPETLPLPPKLDHLVQQIRSRIGADVPREGTVGSTPGHADQSSGEGSSDPTASTD